MKSKSKKSKKIKVKQMSEVFKEELNKDNINISPKNVNKLLKIEDNNDLIKNFEDNINNILNNDEDFIKKNNKIDEKIRTLINKYIKLDKAYQIKHKQIKLLFNLYKNLYYQKKFDRENKIILEKMKNLSLNLKSNDINLYNNRLKILDDIRINNNFNEYDKKYIIKKLNKEFNQEINNENDLFDEILNSNNNDDFDSNNDNLKTDFKNYNNLMNIHKMYTKIFNLIFNNDIDLNKYEIITVDYHKINNNNILKKVYNNQKNVINSLNKIQNIFVEKNIIEEKEIIPLSPLLDNISNINKFNNKLKKQIEYIVDNNENCFKSNKKNEKNYLCYEDKNYSPTSSLYGPSIKNNKINKLKMEIAKLFDSKKLNNKIIILKEKKSKKNKTSTSSKKSIKNKSTDTSKTRKKNIYMSEKKNY